LGLEDAQAGSESWDTAFELTTLKEPPSAKWIQYPDTTSNGINISLAPLRIIADDFECTQPGLMTDVHLWGSWKDDLKGQITNIHLSIHPDDPVGPGGSDPDNTYSKPDELLPPLWAKDFPAGQFTEHLYTMVDEGEWWWDPFEGQLIQRADRQIWQINIYIDPDEAFYQEGTPEQPVIYWLDVRVDTDMGEFGWKTRQWPEHFMDDAVWDYGSELPRQWKELRYPPGHPYYGLEKDSIDMAFKITFQPVVPPELDWGDAPDSPLDPPGYPTLAIHNGANHVIAGPWLGDDTDAPDAEADGQPDANAACRATLPWKSIPAEPA